MSVATVAAFIDKHHPRKDGKCAVKVKVTFKRLRKYYPTGIYLSNNFDKNEKTEFEKVMFGKRRTQQQSELKSKIDSFTSKADSVIKELKIFTYNAFEEKYFENENAYDTIKHSFEARINELKQEKRLGTASSYQCAINSLESFKKGLTFADITPKLLKGYEGWVLEQGKSISTVGIYLRGLRAIMNLQNIDSSLYPFGEGKGKYSIPTGKNIKKALKIDELKSIYNYSETANKTKLMARDYWFFLYLSNGMNVKDFCLLRWADIDNGVINYERAKTTNTRKEKKKITVALKPQSLAIIKAYGQPSISNTAYVFPHLTQKMSEEKKRATIQQLTKTINKYMKQIAAEVGIEKNVTSYYARHSFATILKRSGAQKELISELLGHSSLDVTENYLDSFQDEHIHEQTNALTVGL